MVNFWILMLLQKFAFQCPSTPAEWVSVADGFWHKWDFPLCTGSLDGKRVKTADTGHIY